jgi:hypothetical protein
MGGDGMSPSYFDAVKVTHIENWAPELLARSIKTTVLRLSKGEAEALCGLNLYSLEMGDKPPQGARKVLAGVRKRIDEALEAFPGGAFVRLGSRSPKDSWEGIRCGFRCIDGARALVLLRDSERVYDDLCLARANGYLPVIVLREWLDIEPWREFRTFVKSRKLVGVSQYFYRDFFLEVCQNQAGLEEAIKEESRRVIPLLPCDDMVVDYVVGAEAFGGRVLPGATMLEINPFGVFTDPCMFDWEGAFGEFELRFREEPVKPVA